jgi:hypothetical protein
MERSMRSIPGDECDPPGHIILDPQLTSRSAEQATASMFTLSNDGYGDFMHNTQCRKSKYGPDQNDTRTTVLERE